MLISPSPTPLTSSPSIYGSIFWSAGLLDRMFVRSVLAVHYCVSVQKTNQSINAVTICRLWITRLPLTTNSSRKPPTHTPHWWYMDAEHAPLFDAELGLAKSWIRAFLIWLLWHYVIQLREHTHHVAMATSRESTMESNSGVYPGSAELVIRALLRQF